MLALTFPPFFILSCKHFYLVLHCGFLLMSVTNEAARLFIFKSQKMGKQMWLPIYPFISNFWEMFSQTVLFFSLFHSLFRQFPSSLCTASGLKKCTYHGQILLWYYSLSVFLWRSIFTLAAPESLPVRLAWIYRASLGTFKNRR